MRVLIPVVGLIVIASASTVRAATLRTIVGFSGAPSTGENPYSGLIADNAGNFYGTTLYGGASGKGTIFRVNKTGTLTTIVNFGGPNGALPYAGLSADAGGNFFYGTTTGGGANLFGTVFRLSPSGTLTTLASFSGGTSGQDPLFSGVIADKSGNLYGTTYEGGTSNYGTVFKLSTDGKLTTITSFTWGTDGAYPNSGLTADEVGNFYGTTSMGGSKTFGYGTVFKIDAVGTLTTVVDFTGPNGASPKGRLIADTMGNLYGTTELGGVGHNGTVFKISATGTMTTLASFSGINGSRPLGALIADAAGNLFGTTRAGGAGGFGTVFKLDARGALTTLVSFNRINGKFPWAGLTADAAGNLYGTTVMDGPGGNGTVFEITETGFLTRPPPPPAPRLSPRSGVEPPHPPR